MRNCISLAVSLVMELTSTLALAQGSADAPAFHPAPQGKTLNLVKPFHASSAWRLVVTEGTPVKDYGDNDAPGALTLCLYKGPAASCLSDAVTPPIRTDTPAYRVAWEPHYLIAAKVVYPQGTKAAPLLMIETGSLHSGDGDQVVDTQLIAYDVDHHAFRRVFVKSTGRNNNEEIRFLADGPLRGSSISAEPMDHLPYGYWIVVYKPAARREYRQVLRYKSATLYNDGNSLAVIDSEMPNIERRLGLCKPGDPIPTPGHGKTCRNPVLRHTELWCG